MGKRLENKSGWRKVLNLGAGVVAAVTVAAVDPTAAMAGEAAAQRVQVQDRKVAPGKPITLPKTSGKAVIEKRAHHVMRENIKACGRRKGTFRRRGACVAGAVVIAAATIGWRAAKAAGYHIAIEMGLDEIAKQTFPDMVKDGADEAGKKHNCPEPAPAS